MFLAKSFVGKYEQEVKNVNFFFDYVNETFYPFQI